MLFSFVLTKVLSRTKAPAPNIFRGSGTSIKPLSLPCIAKGCEKSKLGGNWTNSQKNSLGSFPKIEKS